MSGRPVDFGMIRRMITALGREVSEGDPDDLKHLRAIKDHSELELGKAIHAQRRLGYTDVAIGEALGMTRQAVQQRWPREPGSPVGAGARWVQR